MPAETTFNNDFFNQLGRSPGVIAGVDAVVEEIAATARSTAPEDTGDYKNGITTAGKMQDRYVGLAVGTDKKTMLIESKTGNLARAGKRHMRGRGRG